MYAEVLTSVCCSALCSAVLMSVQQMTRTEQGDPGVSVVTRVYSGYAWSPWLWLRPELGSLLSSLGVRISECDHLPGMVPSDQATGGFHHSPTLSGLHCTTLHSQSPRERRHWHWLHGAGVRWPKSHLQTPATREATQRRPDLWLGVTKPSFRLLKKKTISQSMKHFFTIKPLLSVQMHRFRYLNSSSKGSYSAI